MAFGFRQSTRNRRKPDFHLHKTIEISAYTFAGFLTSSWNILLIYFASNWFVASQALYGALCKEQKLLPLSLMRYFVTVMHPIGISYMSTNTYRSSGIWEEFFLFVGYRHLVLLIVIEGVVVTLLGHVMYFHLSESVKWQLTLQNLQGFEQGV